MFKLNTTYLFIWILLACLTVNHDVSLAQDEFVKFGWSPNVESELSHYHIYRDIESGTMIYLDEIAKTDTTYTDNLVTLGETYFYKLTAVDSLGRESEPSEELMITIGVVSNIDDQIGKNPNKFELRQNYPNPFNPSTTIEYSLPEQSYVTFSIYNVIGKEVKNFVVGSKPAGTHQIHWDGTDNQGGFVASGVYFYQIKAGNFKAVKKSILKK